MLGGGERLSKLRRDEPIDHLARHTTPKAALRCREASSLRSVRAQTRTLSHSRAHAPISARSLSDRQRDALSPVARADPASDAGHADVPRPTPVVQAVD